MFVGVKEYIFYFVNWLSFYLPTIRTKKDPNSQYLSYYNDSIRLIV